MKRTSCAIAGIGALAVLSTGANAEGSISGAAVGGVVGHVAGDHTCCGRGNRLRGRSSPSQGKGQTRGRSYTCRDEQFVDCGSSEQPGRPTNDAVQCA